MHEINKFLDRLQALQISVFTDNEEVAVYCTDWRKRYHTKALAVIRPNNVEQLASAVKLCNEFDICITTQGGNTGLVGGAVPVSEVENEAMANRPHVVILTTKLTAPIEIDRANLTITAGVGHTLQQIQEAADAAGYYFPLSLASEGSCTLGGNLAANAGGVAVLRYGNTRELCLSLEYVNANGEVCGHLRGLRKNNTGYDLRHLLIGSEGTLGIITRACMKIYPKPTAKVVCWANVNSLQSAVTLLEKLQRTMYSELSSYEWMNREAINLVKTHFDLKAPGHDDNSVEHVLMEFTSLGKQEELIDQVEIALGNLLEQEETEPLGLANVFIAQSLAENHTFWALREHISEAQSKEGLNIKHDIACPVSNLPRFHEKTLKALIEAGIPIRPVLFGHLGDGNLHYNLSVPAGGDQQAFLNKYQAICNQIVHKEILEAEGTVSAEHGIGQLKATLLKEITSAANYETMRAIKQAMDPKGLLNPGKMLL